MNCLPSGAPRVNPGFSGVRGTRSFMCIFCGTATNPEHPGSPPVLSVVRVDNRETLFLTYIDRGFLYYFLDERFRSGHILTTGSYVMF